MANNNREFLVLALVSAVIIISVVTAMISGNYSSGYVARGWHSTPGLVAPDSTGAVFTCVYDNGFHWKAEYLNGATKLLPSNSIIDSSSGVTCEPNLFLCGGKKLDQPKECTSNNEYAFHPENSYSRCVCRQQLVYSYPHRNTVSN